MPWEWVTCQIFPGLWGNADREIYRLDFSPGALISLTGKEQSSQQSPSCCMNYSSIEWLKSTALTHPCLHLGSCLKLVKLFGQVIKLALVHAWQILPAAVLVARCPSIKLGPQVCFRKKNNNNGLKVLDMQWCLKNISSALHLNPTQAAQKSLINGREAHKRRHRSIRTAL